jgi:hypothetical protein
MRRGKWLFGCVLAGVAGVSMAAGCGDDSVANAPMDSGAPDQTTADTSSPDTGVEAAPADADAGPACTTDADLTMLTLPDASLDDAGDTIASCIGCIMQNCATQVAACNSDCVCNVAVQKFIQCVAAGTDGGALACGTKLALMSDSNGLTLGECVAGPKFAGPPPGCLDACGQSALNNGDGGGDSAAPEGGGDATPDGAGDAASDSTVDGP